jgi:hypothetical protein
MTEKEDDNNIDDEMEVTLEQLIAACGCETPPTITMANICELMDKSQEIAALKLWAEYWSRKMSHLLSSKLPEAIQLKARYFGEYQAVQYKLGAIMCPSATVTRLPSAVSGGQSAASAGEADAYDGKSQANRGTKPKIPELPKFDIFNTSEVKTFLQSI